MTPIILMMSLVTLTFHGVEVDEKGQRGEETCTAVMVTPHLALTAEHCVEHVSVVGGMEIEDSKEKVRDAVYIDSDHQLDLALIKIKGGDYSYARLSPSLPIRGQRIYTLNSGSEMAGTYNEGIVCNLKKDPDYYGIPMIVHNAAIQHGASGSGLFNLKGELIGINVLSYDGLSEAVDINTVKLFLKKNHVPIR